jgi:hypothetical protein
MWKHLRDLDLLEVLEAVNNHRNVVDYWHDDDGALMMRLWSAGVTATPGEEWPVGTRAVRLRRDYQWSLVERVVDAEDKKIDLLLRKFFGPHAGEMFVEDPIVSRK